MAFFKVFLFLPFVESLSNEELLFLPFVVSLSNHSAIRTMNGDWLRSSHIP